MKAKQLYRIPGTIAACHELGWRDQKASHNDSNSSLVMWSQRGTCDTGQAQFPQKTYTTAPSLSRKWCHVLWLPPHSTKEKQRLAFLFHATV